MEAWDKAAVDASLVADCFRVRALKVGLNSACDNMMNGMISVYVCDV